MAHLHELDARLEHDVDGIVHARDDEEKHEVREEINAARHDERRPRKDGRGDAELEKRLSGRDRHARGKLGCHLRPLERTELSAQLPEKRARAVRRADLARTVEVFLHAVDHLEATRLLRCDLAVGKPACRRHDRRRDRQRPERREPEPPIEGDHADDDDGARYACAEQLRHHVHEQPFLIRAVLHDGVREVGEVALAEKRQREQPQTLGDVLALAGAFFVYRAIGVAVFEQLRHRDERKHDDARRKIRPKRRQRRSRFQVSHEVAHEQEQDAHRRHEHEIRDGAEEHAALEGAPPLIGESERATQHGRPPFR